MREIVVSFRQIVTSVCLIILIPVCLYSYYSFAVYMWTPTYLDTGVLQNQPAPGWVILGTLLVGASVLYVLVLLVCFLDDLWTNNKKFKFGTPKSIPKAKVDKL